MTDLSLKQMTNLLQSSDSIMIGIRRPQDNAWIQVWILNGEVIRVKKDGETISVDDAKYLSLIGG